MISPAVLDRLMHGAWPGLSTVTIDGWLARLAGGVTQRANSTFPLRAPHDLAEAIRRVERLYGNHGLPPSFQISPAAEPPSLDGILAERGYERRAPTLLQVASVSAVLERPSASAPPVTISEVPDAPWMDLWWSVDSRFGDGAKEIGRRILTSCPSLYASTIDDGGLAATGRLATVEGFGGIYCMATRPDARRRGHAASILRALATEAAERGIRSLWLQVVEANRGARALYAGAGFVTASSYHYRTRPLYNPDHGTE